MSERKLTNCVNWQDALKQNRRLTNKRKTSPWCTLMVCDIIHTYGVRRSIFTSTCSINYKHTIFLQADSDLAIPKFPHVLCSPKSITMLKADHDL
jgi:hypothetical protein